jgi:hypothetical protein
MKIRKSQENEYDIELVDSEENIQDVYYGPDQGKNILYTYYWYNDNRGRLKQELRPPGFYHGKPRIYIKENIEKEETNKLISHLEVYYGKKLLAKTDKILPEYSNSYLGYKNDEDSRFQIRTTVNFLLNEGGWKLYKIEDQSRFRKPKKILHKIKISPIKKKKVVCKCKKTVKKRK